MVIRTVLARRVKLIFIIECVFLALEFAKVAAIVVALIFFPETLDKYVLDTFADNESVVDALHLFIKLALIIWGIGFLIEIVLLYVLGHGYRERRPRLLRRWTYFGWVIIALIAITILTSLLQSTWSPTHTVQTVYNVIYALYRIWANLVVLEFAKEIKEAFARGEDSFVIKGTRGPQPSPRAAAGNGLGHDHEQFDSRL